MAKVKGNRKKGKESLYFNETVMMTRPVGRVVASLVREPAGMR